MVMASHPLGNIELLVYGPGDVDISRLSMMMTVEAIGIDELPW